MIVISGMEAPANRSVTAARSSPIVNVSGRKTTAANATFRAESVSTNCRLVPQLVQELVNSKA